MATTELAAEKEIVLDNVTVTKVGRDQGELFAQLATIYHTTWNIEGLCGSVEEAIAKMAAFNPEDCYVVIDSSSREVFALIQTLPVRLPSLAYLPHAFPTYASVEAASSSRQRTIDSNFLICFSINALPGHRVQTPSGPISLARFLLSNLPVPEGANRVAYSRFSQVTPGTDLLTHYLKNLHCPNREPVWMHEALGGLTSAFINHAREKDRRGGGGNVVVAYPRNEAQRNAFGAIRTRRLLQPPPTRTQGNIILFADVP